MARALWSGSISFGLVNIPVRLYTAQREHEVGFHLLHEGTGHRVSYRKVDAETGKELDAGEIVKGYEVEPGQWVTFDPDELDALRPRATRTLDIEDFVDLAQIDPIFYDTTYFLAPDDNPGAKRAYALLLHAMQERGRAGVGRVVIRAKQYLAAVRPFEGVLALSTMRFADEVLHPGDVEEVDVATGRPDAKSVKLALSLIDSLAGPFDPTKYHDTFTEEVRELIAKKAEGETVEAEPGPAPAEGKVTDLMAALQASLEATRRRGDGRTPQRTTSKRGGRKAASSGAKKPAPAKKAAPKKRQKKAA